MGFDSGLDMRGSEPTARHSSRRPAGVHMSRTQHSTQSTGSEVSSSSQLTRSADLPLVDAEHERRLDVHIADSQPPVSHERKKIKIPQNLPLPKKKIIIKTCNQNSPCREKNPGLGQACAPPPPTERAADELVTQRSACGPPIADVLRPRRKRQARRQNRANTGPTVRFRVGFCANRGDLAGSVAPRS